MLEELGISGGTAIIILITLYFIIKWAVKKGVKEAYSDIIYEKTASGIKAEACVNNLESDKTKQE